MADTGTSPTTDPDHDRFASDAVCRTDATGGITWCSAGFAARLGCEPADLVGASLIELIGLPGPVDPELLRKWVPLLVSTVHRQPLHAPSGVRVESQLIVSAVHEGDDFAGTLVFARDAAPDPAPATAGEAGSVFLQVFDEAPFGMVVFDVKGRIVRANTALAGIIGHPCDELVGRDVRDVVTGGDPAADLDLVLAMLEGRSTGYTLEKRFVRPDGEVRNLLVRATLLRDAEGRPMSLVNHIEDVTDRRAAERAEHAHAGLFVDAVRRSPTGAAIVSAEGRVVWSNPKLRSMCGVSERDLGTSTSVLDLLHDDDRPRLHWLLERLRSRGRDESSVEARLRVDAGTCWVAITALAVEASDGGADDAMLQFVDITVQKRSQEELRRRSLRDPLTELANRDGLLQALDDAVTQAGPVADTALLFVDLDGFKLVNDSRGHAVGDDALRAVAAALEAAVRPSDLVARLGGDEFVIIARDVRSAAEATTIGERIGHAIDECVVDGHPGLRLGASIGVVLVDPGSSGVELLAAADAAMYEAKQAPTQNVVIAGA